MKFRFSKITEGLPKVLHILFANFHHLIQSLSNVYFIDNHFTRRILSRYFIFVYECEAFFLLSWQRTFAKFGTNFTWFTCLLFIFFCLQKFFFFCQSFFVWYTSMCGRFCCSNCCIFECDNRAKPFGIVMNVTEFSSVLVDCISSQVHTSFVFISWYKHHHRRRLRRNHESKSLENLHIGWFTLSYDWWDWNGIEISLLHSFIRLNKKKTKQPKVVEGIYLEFEIGNRVSGKGAAKHHAPTKHRYVNWNKHTSRKPFMLEVSR